MWSVQNNQTLTTKKITVNFSNYISGNEGVLISSGESLGGYSLYILNGKLHFEHIRMGKRTAVDGMLPKILKSCSLTMNVQADYSAKLDLKANDKQIGQGKIPRISNHLSFYGMDIGRDAAQRVSKNYESEFVFPKYKLKKISMRFYDYLNTEELASSIELTE